MALTPTAFGPHCTDATFEVRSRQNVVEANCPQSPVDPVEFTPPPLRPDRRETVAHLVALEQKFEEVRGAGPRRQVQRGAVAVVTVRDVGAVLKQQGGRGHGLRLCAGLEHHADGAQVQRRGARRATDGVCLAAVLQKPATRAGSDLSIVDASSLAEAESK